MVNIGRKAGGNSIQAFQELIMDAVDKGPIHEFRETYMPRVLIEKEVMKLENRQRKIESEQKFLASMKKKFEDRVDSLKEVYLSQADYYKDVAKFVDMDEVAKIKISQSQLAKQEDVVKEFRKLKEQNERLRKEMKESYATKDFVKGETRAINNDFFNEFVAKDDYSRQVGKYDSKFSELEEVTMQCKQSL